MKKMTVRDYRRSNKAKIMVGTILHIEHKGEMVPVQVNPECGETLRVQPYGGGIRWQCPRCDKGWWTNGTPPKDLTCHRPGHS